MQGLLQVGICIERRMCQTGYILLLFGGRFAASPINVKLAAPLMFDCNQDSMPNRLATESSPYLLQHANNPVDWYPWGEEALDKAKSENKLMIVSVGYAACHWCHVMEHESFEDEEVAKLMNEHFVCIKVDREERPDVDKVYMDAVQLMTGRGGWPLNTIALPDGRPVYGGTYFRKEQWMQALRQVANLWSGRPQQAEDYAGNVVEAMQKLSVDISHNPSDFDREDLDKVCSSWLEQLDLKWGGRKTRANKFPLPQNLITLMRAGHLLGQEDLLEAVNISLEKIAYGGIYDHVGGGFARYSVDEFWKVPHFEKMLYDNAQLVSAYAEAWQLSGRERYRRVVVDSIEFIQRELTAQEGVCYSSLDADSEGKEGKFYTWSYDEIEDLLGEDARLFCDYYNVHPFGNWEQTNILFVLEEEDEFAQRWNLDVDKFREMLGKGRKILLEAREKRIRPGLDDKVLTSWNALMIKGYVDAWKALGTEEYLASAKTIAMFLAGTMTTNGRLYRNYKEGKTSIPGFLDDYAYFIQALIALYEATFDKSWLDMAAGYLEVVDAQFLDRSNGLYFYTMAEGEQLINRKMETQDDVIPSSNAVMAHNLHHLGILLGDQSLSVRSLDMLKVLRSDVLKHPAWHSVWIQRLIREVCPHHEVVITGKEPKNTAEALHGTYLPNIILAGGVEETLPLLQDRVTEDTTIYVCEGNVCQLPVHRVEDAIGQILPGTK